MVKCLEIQKMECKRCCHEWVPRQNKIYVCPKCKNQRWNEDEGIIRGNKNLSPSKVLNIIINNKIFQEDLQIIGDVVRS